MDLGCDIYVNLEVPCAEIERMLQGLVPDVMANWRAAIDVMRNKGRDCPAAAPGEPDFVNYAHYIEFCPGTSDCTLDEAVAVVTGIVRKLKQAGHAAVPSCDYEEALPSDVRWIDEEYSS